MLQSLRNTFGYVLDNVSSNIVIFDELMKVARDIGELLQSGEHATEFENHFWIHVLPCILQY